MIAPISALANPKTPISGTSLPEWELSLTLVSRKHSSMTTDPTKLSDEEIAQYREQFSDRPEALDALDLIAENEGDLQESASLLAQEAGVTITKKVPNILDELAQKLRKVICDDAFDELMTGLLGAAVGTLAATGQIPQALATPVVIYIAKIRVKKFCESGGGEPKTP